MSGFYAKGIEGILDGTIDLTAASVKAVLIDTSAYTANLATHDFLDDVASGARIGTPQALASKTYTGGKFSSNALAFTGLSSPPTCEALLIFDDTGNAATSRLIAIIDSGTGLPTPSGVSTVNVSPDGTNGWFKIPTS